jgi:amidophosphoribosyltransferase
LQAHQLSGLAIMEGIHLASSEELISNGMSVGEVREYIGSDSLAFLPFDSLTKLLGDDSPTYSM